MLDRADEGEDHRSNSKSIELVAGDDQRDGLSQSQTDLRPPEWFEAPGVLQSVFETRTYELSFIDDDFPISTPVRLPARVRRDLQIVGTVRYEMSLSDAGAWGLGPSSDLVVTFQGPADVTVYADESKHGGVVIVATAPSPPGAAT